MDYDNVELQTIAIFQPLFIKKFNLPKRNDFVDDFYDDCKISNREKEIMFEAFNCASHMNKFLDEVFQRKDREMSLKANVINVVKPVLIHALFEASKLQDSTTFSLTEELQKSDRGNVFEVLNYVKKHNHTKPLFLTLKEIVKHHFYDEYKQYKKELKKGIKHNADNKI